MRRESTGTQLPKEPVHGTFTQEMKMYSYLGGRPDPLNGNWIPHSGHIANKGPMFQVERATGLKSLVI